MDINIDIILVAALAFVALALVVLFTSNPLGTGESNWRNDGCAGYDGSSGGLCDFFGDGDSGGDSGGD